MRIVAYTLRSRQSVKSLFINPDETSAVGMKRRYSQPALRSRKFRVVD